MLTFNNLQNWLRKILAGKQDLEGLHCKDAEIWDGSEKTLRLSASAGKSQSLLGHRRESF